MKNVKATARFAGLLYLLITVAAIIAHMYVPSQVIVADNAAATVENIRNSNALFRVGAVGGELVILISEMVLSVLLYVLLKPVNKTLSLLAAVSRLVMTAVHGINLINYYFVFLLVGGAGTYAGLDAGQTQSLVMLFLDAHAYGFTIGIALLTLHVFILGYLIYKSGFIPKIFGVLFELAAIGYLADSFALLLSPTYTTTPVYFALPIAIAEVAFPIWLLIKAVDAETWHQLDAQPA